MPLFRRRSLSIRALANLEPRRFCARLELGPDWRAVTDWQAEASPGPALVKGDGEAWALALRAVHLYAGPVRVADDGSRAPLLSAAQCRLVEAALADRADTDPPSARTVLLDAGGRGAWHPAPALVVTAERLDDGRIRLVAERPGS